MKKIVFIFSTAAIFIACNSKSKLDADKNLVLTDTSALYKNNTSTDIGKDGKHLATSNHAASNSAGREGNSANTSDNAAPSNNGTAPATQPSDKGWSDAAKGAAIGGGTGAVLGAVVSKDKGKGAVIGGIIGAGTGYVIGRSKDKKSGRVARQKARRKAKKTQ
ncbi:MAG: glycine zipper 2TM domain-containing protein [Bacteroidetes bacterium]|nr:glycine zipper 2TM domain-containing protein [Bacteroidota bacterium]